MAVALVTAACGSTAPTVASVVQDAIARGPQRGDSYRPPTPQVRDEVAQAVAALTLGETPQPPAGWQQTKLAPQLTALSESGSGRLQGYGVFIVRGAGSRVLLEVPHPRYDLHTEDLGIAVFAGSAADVLLVAGAHRTAGHDAADVAHRSDSVFAAVNAALVSPGDLVLQLHGFAEAKHSLDVDAVVSSTTDTPSPVARRLAARLGSAGWHACVYGDDGCTGLGGTTNVEAADARKAGADFVHLELSDHLRDDSKQREQLAQVLSDFLKDERQRRS